MALNTWAAKNIGPDADISRNPAEGGGGSEITVESLTVTENDTYTAPEGKAYSPVIVNVSGGSGDFSEATITFNFTIPEGYGIEQVYGESFKFKYGIREHPDVPGVFRASDLINPDPDVMEITVLLYKGEATVEMFAPVCSVPGYDLIIDYETLVLSGGISYDEDDSVYVITGDGTFTATCTAEPL